MKNENVLSVPVQDLQKVFELSKMYWKGAISQIDSFEQRFEPRSIAETDFTMKQVIPYALLLDESGRVLSYRRCGSEKRLKGIRSVGFGGHVNDGDRRDTFSSTLKNGLIRELAEEIGLTVEADELVFVGFINEEETEVGHCHIGAVFTIVPGDRKLRFDAEIGDPEWISPSSVDLSQFELWSSLALQLLKSVSQ